MVADDQQAKRGLLSSGHDHDHDARHSYELADSDHDRESDIDATEFLTADPLYDDDASQDKNKNKNTKKNIQGRRAIRWLGSACLPKRWSRSRCCIVALAIGGAIFLLTAASGGFVYKKLGEEPPYGQSPPWYHTPLGGTAKTWADSYAKAAKMVNRMTLPEKVNVTTGTGWQMGLSVGTNGPAVHVGFPQLQLQDGPLGIRMADNITALPAGITVGATWNRALMYAHGKAHALEARAKGVHALLGPCVGPLGRMPAGGRNWEGFGSDPYLQGIAGAETIRGIQDQGIMATIKHFVGNEQEHFRQPYEWGLPHALSSNIDDRTLHELYAWPFGDAVKAGVASVMCSYNMVNNSYSCGNSKLLNGILKDELGFQGFIMSDWLAQRSGVSTALAGLDMTMPGDGLRWQNGLSLWGSELTRSVLNGSVPLERLNDMATRIVAAWYQLGQDDPNFFSGFDGAGERPNFSSWTYNRTGVLAPGSPSAQETVVVNQFINVQGDHANLARNIAAEGIVLLKNVNNTLPIGTDGITGQPNRIVKAHHPTQSSKKTSEGDAKRDTNTVAPTPKIKIGIFGEDAGAGQGPNFCENRACNQGTLGSGWGSGAVEFPYLVTPADALSATFDESKVDLRRRLSNRGVQPESLTDLDVCFVFANADAGEGFVSWGGNSGDRNDLLLQKGGDDLIYSVATGCGDGKGDVIVVIHSVGPVVMERWIDLPQVKAVVYANLPGQESGNALADVMFGRVNPSGKLPYTLGRTLDDYGPGGKVMYIPNGVVPQQDFSEGLYIDYRHFDKYDIEPRYEFGFGLSYTQFIVGNLSVKGVLPKSALPAARPPPAAKAPTYDTTVPDAKEALFPKGIRRLKKYIYPYLDSVDDLDIASGRYPYPDGYDTVQPPSGAGGEEGGNPDLWETYVSVSVDVSNVGSRDGKAVVQLYLVYPEGAADAAGVDFPVKVLRGFEKPTLKKGETQTVDFNLTRRDLSYWDVQRQNWAMVTGGAYRLLVGQSSRDLPVHGTW